MIQIWKGKGFESILEESTVRLNLHYAEHTSRKCISVSTDVLHIGQSNFSGYWHLYLFLWCFVIDKPIRNLVRAFTTCLLESSAKCISVAKHVLYVLYISNIWLFVKWPYQFRTLQSTSLCLNSFKKPTIDWTLWFSHTKRKPWVYSNSLISVAKVFWSLSSSLISML